MAAIIENGRASKCENRTSTIFAKAKNPLPPELVGMIFAGLDNFEIQNAVLVSRDMRDIVLQATSTNEVISVGSFVESLVQGVDEKIFPEQKSLLLKILSQKPPLNLSNLIILKEYALEVKKQLVDVMKRLDLETLARLESRSVRTPRFMEDLFPLAGIEQRLCSLPPGDGGAEIWIGLCADLASLGYVDRVVEWVVKLPQGEQDDSLINIFFVLVDRQEVDRAVELAVMVPQLDLQLSALRNLATILADRGRVDKAIEVAMCISHLGIRLNTLENVSSVLAGQGLIEEAFELALGITDEWVKGSALATISRGLASDGDAESAVEVAVNIPARDLRLNVIAGIFRNLANLRETNRAVEIAMSLPDVHFREEVLLAAKIEVQREGDPNPILQAADRDDGSIERPPLLNRDYQVVSQGSTPSMTDAQVRLVGLVFASVVCLLILRSF